MLFRSRIDKFLLVDDLDVLKEASKIFHEIACGKALTEFENIFSLANIRRICEFYKIHLIWATVTIELS